MKKIPDIIIFNRLWNVCGQMEVGALLTCGSGIRLYNFCLILATNIFVIVEQFCPLQYFRKMATGQHQGDQLCDYLVRQTWTYRTQQVTVLHSFTLYSCRPPFHKKSLFLSVLFSILHGHTFLWEIPPEVYAYAQSCNLPCAEG